MLGARADGDVSLEESEKLHEEGQTLLEALQEDLGAEMEPSLTNDSVVLQALSCEFIASMNKPIITIPDRSHVKDAQRESCRECYLVRSSNAIFLHYHPESCRRSSFGYRHEYVVNRRSRYVDDGLDFLSPVNNTG